MAESEQIGASRGAPERATGMYTIVHEDRERGVTKARADLRRLYGFENTRGAHAGAHAHRHHTVLLLASAQAVHDRCGPHRAGRAQRVTERNRAAQRIDPRRVEPELLDHGEALRGERLVQFDPADVILLDAGALEHLRDRSDRADPHQDRKSTRLNSSHRTISYAV